MSKVSEEQAAEILRESMERTSPIRQQLDAHCRALDQRIQRAKDPHVRIEELEMANEHCHEAMQKQAQRIVDLETELASVQQSIDTMRVEALETALRHELTESRSRNDMLKSDRDRLNDEWYAEKQRRIDLEAALKARVLFVTESGPEVKS